MELSAVGLMQGLRHECCPTAEKRTAKHVSSAKSGHEIQLKNDSPPLVLLQPHECCASLEGISPLNRFWMLLCGSAFITARFCTFPQRPAVNQHYLLASRFRCFLPPATWLRALGALSQVSLEANGAASNPLSGLSDAIDESVSTKAFRHSITDNIIIIVFKNVGIAFCL